MTKDEILKMARQAGFSSWDEGELQSPFVEGADLSSMLEAFAKLVADVATAKEREAWRNAAIRVGENLATCGPAGYYDFEAQQWLNWALDATTKMQNDYMNLGACGEREACAKVCENVRGPNKSYGSKVAKECAETIRARGEA